MAYQSDQQSSRQKMRPWLESRINSGEIPGLEWVDQTQMIFKVPWKNVANRGWREDDSQIFKVEFCVVLNVYCYHLISLFHSYAKWTKKD